MMPKLKRELINYMLENYDKSIEIKEFCDKILQEQQIEFIKNPSVYIAVLKRQDNPSLKYVTAKTLFPIGINKFREYRYYVGTLNDFPAGAKDKRAKLLGEKIVKEKLAEKYKSNTFTL